MPPRRSRRFQAQEPAPTNIASLSDDLLAKCFASLSQEDRLRGAAFVCRHWLEVTTRPELLREVVFNDFIFEYPADTLRAAQSLLWLNRHSRHVRAIDATLHTTSQFEKAETVEMMSVLDSWVVLCGDGLEKLSVSLDDDTGFTIGSWAFVTHRLRELKIRNADPLCSFVTMTRMTSLQRLDICTFNWRLGTSVALPASLSRLCIRCHQAGEMPSQIAALTNLRSLELERVEYYAAGMGSLARLSSLQYASFRQCKLPDCLPDLTGLRALQIANPRGQAAAVAASLDSTLRQLTQLTGLWLDGLPSCNIVSPSLAALSSLQWFYLWSRNTPHGQAEAVLPLGPWQRSLCHLATAYTLARHNLQFLSGAERLQRLSFLEPPALQAGAEEQWQAFCRWAAQHKPLQCVDCLYYYSVGDSWKNAIQQLQAKCPNMHIEFMRSIAEELLVDWT